MYRTHNCGELRTDDVNKKVRLAGWIQTIRDMGGIVFIDLRDQYGITQLVSPDDQNMVDELSRIPTESTISVTGTACRFNSGYSFITRRRVSLCQNTL